MLRILLLILVGFVVTAATLQTIAAIVLFAIDMKDGGQHAPEILGIMTGSIVITLGFGWVWKKVYFWRRIPDTASTN